MAIDREHFVIREHCHINQNGDGDRFVGVKADSNNAMIYFPMGYELPAQDDELRRDIKICFKCWQLLLRKPIACLKWTSSRHRNLWTSRSRPI